MNTPRVSVKNVTFLASTLLLGLSDSSLRAQIFSDNFTTDASLGAGWFNMVNSTAASFALNPTAGQGLALNVNSGSTGKTDEAFTQFTGTPVTLGTTGDSVSLTVDFNSPNLAANTGGLLVGLYNTLGSPATGNLTGNVTGGATATHQGYFGVMGFNTSSGVSTKFFSRQGGAADNNELGYYSTMTSGSYTQLGAFAASGNANLANNTGYVLTYTITKGTGNNAIAAVIQQGSTVLDTWNFTDAAGSQNTFDELDFGTYGKNAAVNVNITQISVSDSLAAVPEPSSFGLIGAGLLAIVFRRKLLPA